jgi:hypothetical protein
MSVCQVAISLLLGGHCLRVANFGEGPTGEVRRIYQPDVKTLMCTGFGCTKQSRRRTKATTSPYFHPFGVALQQGPWITGVKIALAVARFHNVGVALAGP